MPISECLRPVAVASVAILIGSYLAAAQPAPLDYDRAAWGRWDDLEGDCWDTRAEALLRAAEADSLVVRTDRRPCRVVALCFADPYTGERWCGQASKVDVDHVVSLAEAHRSGGGAWDAARRRAFYNDPLNHLPTVEGVNASKSDTDPGGQRFRTRKGERHVAHGDPWVPPDPAAWCHYGRRWVAVKTKWDLDYDAREVQGILRLLAACHAPPYHVEPLYPAGPVDLPGAPP